MAPFMIDGNTLKEKHRSYNKIVNDTIKNNSFEQITEINYEESDLENLFKIDIASHNRNVEYILTVLKGQDMLYISRAIKQATWLITDPQNAPIINPNYLYNDLFPQMTSKAINKFILHIRLNLKDEQRVEEFFNYYKEKDLKTGFKWLPHCSNTFIENIVSKHANDIPSQLLKRLCEKSILFLDIFLKNYTHYYKVDVLKSTLFLLNYNAESYIDIVERNNVIESLPALGPKFTKILMNKCGDKVKQNLDKFCQFIHIPTFAKYIKKEEVKEIILKNLRNRRMSYWFSHINVKHFVYRLPAEERFELIKEIFIEKKYQDDAYLGDDIVPLHTSYRCASKVSSENIYCWYIYAPFNIAFTDLKKMIRSESNPSDRMGMFGVMLACAKNNMQDIQTLLKYYRENHINEPYKFKSQFANLVVTRTHTHRYNKTTWGYLNDLFISMEVYTESDKNVQFCFKSIVLYNIINDQSVPEVVEKNLTFDTFKKYHIKFTQDEKDKVFSYLFIYINLKLNKYDKTKKEDLTEAVEVLKNILELLEDWGKELHDFPTVIEKIKDIVNIKRTNKSWECNLTKLYNVPKSWKKLLFEESIVLNPNQEACINALKHGPHVLETCKEEVEVICVSDNILAERFLRKIRIYWSESLANDFKKLFMKKLHQNNKAVITGLCTLLPQQEFISLVQKYIPKQEKIDWNQHDEVELSACKHIASCLHIARPQPSLDIALSFAKGDYLQYILPSLSAILYNVSCENGRNYVRRLLDAPVSLKKHGIRFSFKKLQNNELKPLYSDIWKSNKNSIIRSDIFTQTYNMLCNEQDPVTIKDIWQLISMFIDNLSSEENKNIYTKLSKVDKVPLPVRAEYLMKSYRFLKSLPAKANCSNYVNRLTTEMKSIMEFIDDDFLEEVFMESFDKKFSTRVYENIHLIAASVLSCKAADTQMRRYNKILVPILDRALAMWDTTHNNNHYVKYNLYKLYKSLSQEFTGIVLQNEMTFPIAIFRDFLERLQNSLVPHENYFLITKAKLTLDYIQILEEICEIRKDIVTEIKSKKCNEYKSYNKWEPLHDEAAPKFGEICLKYLKNDVANYFPSVYESFAAALNDVFEDFNIRLIVKFKFLKCFVDNKDFIQGYLLILKLLPDDFYHSDEKALGLELLNTIKSHPSQEINMHYWQHLKDKFIYLN